MYDACVNDESQYLTSYPKGCNGHALSTLWEQQSTLDMRSNINSGPYYGDYFFPRLILSGDTVYWTDASGRTLRAAKRGGGAQVILESGSKNTAVRGFDAINNRLYVVAIFFNESTQRTSSRIIGIDVGTGESRVLADLADTALYAVNFVGGRFYFPDASGTALLTGSLAWESTAKVGDLRTCAPSAFGSLSGSTYGPPVVAGSKLFYLEIDPNLNRDGAPSWQLVSVDLETCTIRSRVPFTLSANSISSLFASEDELYLQEYDNQTLYLTVSRVDSAGGLTRVAHFQANYTSLAPTICAGDIYLATGLGDTPLQPPRLYGWHAGSDAPVALAAPMGGETTLAGDVEYLYVLQRNIDSSGGVLETSSMRQIERLLRIRR